MWRELIAALPGETTFREPASEASIRECEQQLGHALPEPLNKLLRESNGAEGVYGLGLIWPVERITTDNLALRSDTDYTRLYMPFEPLLFFADAGNGDQFALTPHIDRPDVFAWNHEDDSRTWVAPSLAKYLDWQMTSQITL